MRIRRNNITNLLLFAIIAICLYLIQRIAVFEVSDIPNTYAGYRDLMYPEYILVFAALLGVSAWYIFVEKRKGDLKLHVPLIILLSVLFIISTVMICLFPSKFIVDVPVYLRYYDEMGYKITVFDHYKLGCLIEISLEQKILYILISFAVLYMVYLTLWVMPRKIRYLRELDLFMYIIIALAIVAMVYSYIAESGKYMTMLTSLFDERLNPEFASIESFLGNRNSFGMALLFALFACLYLHHLNRRWWFIPLAFIFLIQIIAVGSKTNAMIGVVVYLIYFIIWMVFRFKKHLVSSLIVVGIISLIVIALVVFNLIHLNNEEFMVNYFSAQDKLSNYFVVRVFNNQDSLSGRNANYDKALLLFNCGYWPFGMGYGLFNYVINGMENLSIFDDLRVWDSTTINNIGSDYVLRSDSPHSAYFQMIGTGGITTLVVYGILICYLIFAMVRVFKKNKMTVILCALFLAGALFHGVVESPALFFMGPVQVDSFLFTVFIAIPIFSLYHHNKHPSENRKFLADYEQKDAKLANFNKSCLIAKSIYFFMTPVIIIMCVITPILYTPNFENHLAITIVMLSLLGVYIIAPIIAQLISDRKTPFGQFLLRVSIPYFVEVIVFGGFILLYKLAFGQFTLTLGALFLLLTLVAHIALFSRSKFYNDKAGIISLLMDKTCNIAHKYQEKYIVVEDKEDSMTLQEKVFYLITPKRFRKHETRNS